MTEATTLDILREGANLEVLGKTYDDVYGFYWDGESGSQQFTAFMGENFSGSNSQELTNGKIEFILSAVEVASQTIDEWIATGLDLSASQVVRAGTTRSTGDDLKVFADAFSGNDTFILSHSDDFAEGFAGNDIMRGGAGDDTLKGGFGNDRLAGGDGDDTLFMGVGDDLMMGGAGADTLWHSASTAIRVDLAVTKAQATGAGRDTIVGIENVVGGTGNDRIFGNHLGNYLEGRGGADRLEGRGGDDWLAGGAGRDTLTGGVGEDRFVFAKATDMGRGAFSDLITDFKSGVDQIRLDLLDVDFRFITGGKLTGTGPELTFRALDKAGTRNDVTVVIIDADGDGKADANLRLAGLIDLDQNDFVF